MTIRLPAFLAASLCIAAPLAAQGDGGGMLSGAFKGASGTVTVAAAPHGVLVHVEVAGLTPGWHGIHFHEKGDCSDAAFKLSGGHVHEGAASVHGLLNPAATDEGDLPNLYVAADGTAKAEFLSALVRLPALMDLDGAALVIHAAPDDYRTQPIGGAGARVACAVLK